MTLSFLSQNSKKQLKLFLSLLKGRKAKKVKRKDLEVSGPSLLWGYQTHGGVWLH